MELQSVEHGQPLPLLHDPSDFEAFVRIQREGLVRFLRRRTPLEEDAQDLAQESLARLIRYRGHAPTAWASLLYRIAINALNDRLRRAHTHREARHTTLDSDLAELASSEPSHEQRIATQQELAVLQHVLLGLPLRCRQIYLLNRIEGMSYTEIADHCGISVKAVEKHISKALKLLRARLAPFNREIPRP
ncbi:RNA polymerase sigma factor [Rhodanobacter ginsengisoli]|uniref:RNA polymerase sigma factor n=1 Tax=Rhodanobacter ginsengisoli TaxID=418646 RepID=A0ABW0QKX7_9GAMM